MSQQPFRGFRHKDAATFHFTMNPKHSHPTGMPVNLKTSVSVVLLSLFSLTQQANADLPQHRGPSSSPPVQVTWRGRVFCPLCAMPFTRQRRLGGAVFLQPRHYRKPQDHAREANPGTQIAAFPRPLFSGTSPGRSPNKRKKSTSHHEITPQPHPQPRARSRRFCRREVPRHLARRAEGGHRGKERHAHRREWQQFLQGGPHSRRD